MEIYTGIRGQAIKDVNAERDAQEKKWGEQNHHPYLYLTVLMEEVGELSQAVLQTQFGGKHGTTQHMREEAVQVAAVALAIIECLDRGKYLIEEVPCLLDAIQKRQRITNFVKP